VHLVRIIVFLIEFIFSVVAVTVQELLE